MLRRLLPGAIAVLGLARPALGEGPRSVLYVDNTAGNDITVVDAAADRVIGTIETGPAPHGLAVSPDGSRLYVSSEGRDELIAIDTATDSLLWRRPLLGRPNELSISADGRRVFVPIRGGNFVEVVDTQTRRTVACIPIGVRPHNSYRSPDGRLIFATSMGGDSVSLIDPDSLRVVGVIPLTGEPRPLAISPDSRYVYAQLTGLHGLVVADVARRRVIRRVELPPADVTVVSAYGYTPSHGIAIRPGRPELWSNNVYGDSVDIFSLPDLRLVGNVPVGGEPDWMDFSKDGRRLFVSNPETNDVSVIDCDRRAQITRIPVGLAPKRVLFANLPECREDSPGWRAAAGRPSATDYYLKDGGLLGCDLDSFGGRARPLAEWPALCRRMGLFGLELDASRLASAGPEGRRALGEALRRDGRLVTAIDLDSDFISEDGDRDQASIDSAKEAIGWARQLGAPVLCLRLGREESSPSVSGERAARALRQLLPDARELGVRLALESGPDGASSPDSILGLIRATDPAWVGSCLEFQVGQPAPEAEALIAKLGPSALHARLDCRAFDRWGNESSIDYATLLPLLARCGYGSALSIRYVGPDDPVPGVCLLRDLLVKLWIGKGTLPRGSNSAQAEAGE